MSYADETGIYLDDFTTTKEKLVTAWRAIFGDDANFDDVTRLGQLANDISERIADQNELLQIIVNSQDPLSAIGIWLEQMVKINGIDKNEAAFSTVTLQITANTAGTTVYAGDIVTDPNAESTKQFAVDNTTTVAPSATALVSATALQAGAIEANSGTLTKIVTPRYGWASVTNTVDASVGALEESDAALRARRELAAQKTGNSSIAAVYQALADIDAVERLKVYQNINDTVDALGVPAHSLWAIVLGGNDADIAATIFSSWAGYGLYGNTTYNYADPITGETYAVKWSRPSEVLIRVKVQTKKSAFYPGDGDQQIAQNIFDFFSGNFVINGIPVASFDLGGDVVSSRLYTPANAVSGHDIQDILISRNPAAPTSSTTIELDPDEIAGTELILIEVENIV